MCFCVLYVSQVLQFQIFIFQSCNFSNLWGGGTIPLLVSFNVFGIMDRTWCIWLFWLNSKFVMPPKILASGLNYLMSRAFWPSWGVMRLPNWDTTMTDQNPDLQQSPPKRRTCNPLGKMPVPLFLFPIGDNDTSTVVALKNWRISRTDVCVSKY